MFEADVADEYRQSLGCLADALMLDDERIIKGYRIYKKLLAEGKAKYKPSEAFDALLKILIKEREN